MDLFRPPLCLWMQSPPHVPIQALQRTLPSMGHSWPSMVLPTAPHLANHCVLVLRVGQTLATPPLRYLSSPLARMVITLLCSRRSQNASELPKTGASFTVGPNQMLLFPLPTSSDLRWMLSFLIFPLWTPRNPLHLLMPHMPMICETANLLPAVPSFCVAAPSPTDARHSLSPLPAPPKRSSLPPLPPQSMFDTCEPSWLTLAFPQRAQPSCVAIINRPSIWSTLVCLLSALVTLTSSTLPFKTGRNQAQLLWNSYLVSSILPMT